MKHLKSYLTALTLVTFFACQQEGEVTPELNAPSTANAERDNSRAVLCDNDVTYDGEEFDGGEHTLTGHLADEFELLLNNSWLEPLPSNCSWTNLTTNELFFYELDGCCYTASQLNGKLEDIQELAQDHAPSSDWLITGYEVVFIGYPPRFRVRAFYKKKGICSLPPEPIEYPVL